MPTADGVTIRLARVEDAEALADLARRTFVDTYEARNPPGTLDGYLAESFGAEIQRGQILDPAVSVLVAILEGELAGYALLRAGETPESVRGDRPVELVRLYADHRVHGRGVGAALMQASLDEARGRGFETLWLAVWDRNTDAQAFYRRWGFQPAGTIPFPLGETMQTDFLLERSTS